MVAPLYVIGSDQPGGAQFHTLNGIMPGFSPGVQGTGTVKPMLDALEVVIGTQIEAYSMGFPNSFGTTGSPALPTQQCNALVGETNRMVSFSCPMVPLFDSTASLTKLIRGDYDVQLHAIWNYAVAHGAGGKNRIARCGWEYNSGATSLNTYPWSTGYTDPQTGSKNGISQVLLGAAHYEAIARAEGFLGYFDWNLGNGDTTSLPPATAMPTHGDPALTLLGDDVYSSQGGQLSRNDPVGVWNKRELQINTYLAYCRANGYLYWIGEYDQTFKANSPYGVNDTDLWFPKLWQKCHDNADVIAGLVLYHQNQSSSGTAVLDEVHQIMFSDGISGSPATAAYTSNTAAASNTQANMGNERNAGNSGTTWVFTNDPNKQKAKTSWLAYFGGTAGRGAGSMEVAPVTPPAPAPAVGLVARHPRVYSMIFGVDMLGISVDGAGVITAASGAGMQVLRDADGLYVDPSNPGLPNTWLDDAGNLQTTA